MKLYCKVENNRVIGIPSVLSIQDSMKSDFELLENGWYVVEQTLPESFDERFEVMNVPQYEILQYKVKATYTKREKTEEEMQQFISHRREQLEYRRNQELLFCEVELSPDSDFYKSLSIQEKEHWRDYKKTLEDLFVLNANKNIWEFDLPNKPPVELLELPKL